MNRSIEKGYDRLRGLLDKIIVSNEFASDNSFQYIPFVFSTYKGLLQIWTYLLHMWYFITDKGYSWFGPDIAIDS